MINRILRWDDILRMSELSKSTIYLYIKKGIFPRPIPLLGRTIGWNEAEFNQWLVGHLYRQNKIIKVERVMYLTGLRKSTIHWYVRKGLFPKMVPGLTKKSKNLGWVEEEVYEWIRNKISFYSSKVEISNP